MKSIAILGSTGSIGRNTLDVVRRFPKELRVTGLSTNANIELMLKQIKEFCPLFVAVNDEKAALKLKAVLRPKTTKILVGDSGLKEIVKNKQTESIVLAISGSAAFLPLLTAIDSKKDIALANKEALVMAGPLIMEKAKRSKVNIVPIDSEQSAIWQCLGGEDQRKLKNIYLTASGGPLRQKSEKELKRISLKKVLRHPRWKMGRKITVDSATMMNKGLEVLEAMYLFGVSLDKIKIIIHPEAIIHSMVEFIDGVILAQLSVTDMRIPIQYALLYPKRLNNRLGAIDFYKLKNLTFHKPNFKKFPCLKLAYFAASIGGTMPAVLSAANEVGVSAFLEKKLNFVSIPKIINLTMQGHKNVKQPGIEDIFYADSWARREAHRIICALN